ncbi:hypothetical protein Tco_0729999 [Tanacetum coccineum]|uniref:Uncharacterized protein n=1 Tax=Tanacetum coccineum TaxID=301880 RepID=A0ABQ4YTM2_9ASTR
MSTMAKIVIAAGAENHPPMLERIRYDSWQSRMLLYIRGKEHVAKEIWDRVKLLIEGSKLSLQEPESKLYNEFDRFTFEKGETIHSYYLSKFVADVKLAKDMHNTNFDELYAYLRQHEVHANKVRMMRQRFPNPLALVANTYNSPPFYNNQPQYNLSQYHLKSLMIPQQQQFYSPPPQQKSYEAPLIHQQSY